MKIEFWLTVFLIVVAASPTQAAVVINAVESNGSVELTVEQGGSLDLTGLVFTPTPNEASGAVAPLLGGFAIGDTIARQIDAYTGITGPMSFGSGELKLVTLGQGDRFGISGSSDSVMVPDGYISGGPLSGNSTYFAQTFESLGITAGTYQWSWASDSLTLNVVAPVPLPAAFWLLASTLAVIGSIKYRDSKEKAA